MRTSVNSSKELRIRWRISCEAGARGCIVQTQLQDLDAGNAVKRVAVQGVGGCFSHQALRELLPGAEAVFFEQAAETREALREGRVDGVLLPVENSLAGEVTEHAELVRQMVGEGARVGGEHRMGIRQQLIGLPGATVEGLERVYSHAVALKQCRRFFAERPRVRAEGYFDTAGAVERVMREGDVKQAAIAGALAAEIYGGEILLADIHDTGRAGAGAEGSAGNPVGAENTTRFVLVWVAGGELPEG
jgi:prephenate dehydratase